MSEPKNQDKSGKPISRSKEKRAKNAPFPSSVMVDSSLGGKGNPGWLHTPPVAVSPEDAKRLIEARTLKGPRNYKPVTRTHSIAAESSNTVQSPASIVELARALKNDADLIFYHVYNNIEFHPTWGVQKGSLGCLIDGIGNSFDQCALLVDLLREAGYTANFVSGVLRLEEEDVAGWLGTDPSNLYFSSYVLSQGGIPNEVVYVGGPTFNYVIDVSHIWVEVTIGGTDYVFDPAFKSYSTVAGINLGTALDYSQSELLDGADDGATIDMDGNYIEDVNAANIKAQLATYAGNLIDWIKTNNPDATMDEIVGGRTINQIFTPVRVTTHPKLKPATTPDVWSSISNSYRVTVRLEYAPYWSGSIDETFYSDELYGKRLTLFFNGSLEAELRLDGTLIATSSAQSAGTTSPMRITVDHPYGVNWFDQTFYQNVYAPHATLGQTYYLIGNAFGPTKKGMVDFHQHRLALAELAGGGDLSDSVLGERLSILWHTYTAEHFRIGDILGRMTECIGLAHHMIGMCAHSTYPDDGFGFFDVQGVRIAGQSLDNTTTDSAKYMTALGMHGYTLEQLVPQQVLGQTDGAAATKLLEVANADGVRIYKATGANWSSDVSPNLTGYNLANPSDLYTYYLQYGWVGVIPEEADQVIGPLTTEGWSVLNPSGGGFGILQASYGGICPWGWVKRKKCKCPCEEEEADPVGLRTGDYSYRQTDLEVGSQNFPYKLSLDTYYRSNQRYYSGPLGLGWNHNWQITATKDSNGFKGLGIDSPIDAAASITEFYACLDLLTDTDFPILNLMTAILGNAWWCEQLTGNVVIMDSVDETWTYTKLPDGSFNAPHGDASTLVQNMDGTYSVTSPQQVVKNFDEDGNLESWEFPQGVTITLTYSSGKLETVSNGMGRTLYFDYVGDKLVSVSDDAERTVEYTIDVDDQLTAITDVLEEDTTFEYDQLGRMTKYFLPEHPSDPMVTNTYDTLDRIASQLDVNLNEQSFYLAGWRSEFVNAIDDSKVYFYDASGNLVKEIDELGFETTYSYDGLDRLTETVMPEGNSIVRTYDAKNNVLTITQAAKPGSALDDIVETRTYDSTFNKVDSIEDGRGNTTTFTYDPVTGSLLTIEKPEIESEVPTITFTYTARGQVETREDETGIVTKYEYSSTDETLETVTVDFGMGRLNLATNLTYFEWGDVETVTDARSNTTTYTFNDKRQLTQIESPSPFNFLTKFTYDKNGNRTKVERQTDDVAHPWQTFEAGYNLANQIVSLKDPLENETVREYNDLRQLWKVTDPENRTTTYTYDARGMLETITDPDSVVIETRTYSDNGKLASQEDARNNVTSMTYDGFDRLDTTTYADETLEQNAEYDENGNLLRKLTRNGDTIAFTFDVLNRMETKSPDGMPTVTFSYDLAGRLKKASTPVIAGNPASGDWEFEFDTAGRLVLESSPDGKEVAYEPDENDNITKIIYPDSYYVERFYDEMDRLTDIKLNGDTDPAAHFTYDSLSRRLSIEYDNGTEIGYAYEWNDDMSSIENLFVGSSVDFTYGFNTAHKVDTQTVSDAQHMWHPSTTGTTTYTTANEVNQYPAVGGKDFTYNRNGCLTSDGDMLFNYDTENHLTTAIRCDGMSTYVYDPMHRQIQKKVGCSSKTRFVYSGWQRLADYDELDSLQTRYVFGASFDEPLIQVASLGDVSYLHHDRLGSIIAITNDTGGVLNRYAYSPWGECDDMSGSSLGFTGQRYDSESDLLFYKYRYYSPKLGRFLQPDPLGGMNVYEYVLNSPLNNTDPLGLEPEQLYQFNPVRNYYGNWGGWEKTNGKIGSKYGELTNFPYKPKDEKYKKEGFKPPKDQRDLCYYRHDVDLHNCARIVDCETRKRCRKNAHRGLGDCLEAVSDTYGNKFGIITNGEIEFWQNIKPKGEDAGDLMPNLDEYEYVPDWKLHIGEKK